MKNKQMVKMGKKEYDIDGLLTMSDKSLKANTNGRAKAMELFDSGCFLSVKTFSEHGPCEFVKPNDDESYGWVDPDLIVQLAREPELKMGFIQHPGCNIIRATKSRETHVDPSWVRTQEQYKAEHPPYIDSDDEDE